ncbi:MAG: beta strand repeat-containing protein [Spirochaetota bacterium]
MENDAGKAAPTYEEWVALVGQDKTDKLYAGIGQDSLNLLAYGIGQSNMVQLINGITEGAKLVTLVGNDGIAGTGPGSASGLGAVVTVYLLKSVDTQMQANISSNLVGGGVAPTDQDTVTNLVNVINGLTATEIQQKLIDLFGPSGFDLSRSMSAATTLSAAEQQLVVDRMARTVAHVDNTVATCTKICTLMTSLTAAEVTGKLAPMIKYNLGSGMTLANKLVETIESTTNIANLVTVVQGVTIANVTGKMMPILDGVNDCTKMGYTINNVTALTTLINLINNVQVPARMGQLINLSEDGGTWAGQVSPAETWGVPVKAAPFGTAGAGATITANVPVAGPMPAGAIAVSAGGTNYLPGTTVTFAGCAPQPTVHLNIVGGIIQNTGNFVVAGGNCSAGVALPGTIVSPVAPNRTAMERLVAVINGIAPASDYYKLLNLVDNVGDMNKMVRLVQDLNTVTDITDLLNNMAGVVGATCAVANGTDTGVSIVGGGGAGATATSFNVSSGVAYIRVTAGGAGYTSPPTITVPGCTLVSYTATISGGAITAITANTNSMNNMALVVDLMTLANINRLQQVVDGQRAFDNTNESQQTNASLTTTYLGKLRVLMVNLSQPQEGPVKVRDLLDGVTNTDKIIDLIWGVTTTTNLSTVINGIFKASEVPGCSDGSAGTFAGPSTTTASDTGTCESSGNGFFFGERDTAVTTLVYLVENVASSAKLITMIDNITPANVIALVNHTATYSQHADHPTPGSSYHVYPRGATNLDPQAAGKRLAKIVDNTTDINQLVYVTNNVSAIIKMAKLVSFMDIGTLATNGTGKLAVLINAVTGTNAFLATTVPGRGNPTGNATGMGKMVNVIEFISGATTSAAMVQLKDLMNDVTDINKMADLINQTVNSSNIVGLLNGVTDPRYGTSTADLVTLMNNLPRGEIGKLVSLIGEIGNATGTTTATFPGADHVLIAQLMSAYNAGNIATTSGVGVSDMSALIGTLSYAGGQNYTTAPTVGGLNAGGGAGATATASISASLGAVTRVTLTNEGSCDTAPTGATVGGGGTGATVAFVTAPESASATKSKVKAIYLTNGGSGYSASTITFTGGVNCTPSPAATTAVNGVIGASVTAGGAGYTDSFTGVTFTGGGGTGATASALVAGPINTLTSYYGGSGYTTGNICPINGAGGDGTATCTVTAAAGVLTGCSAIAGGTGYIDGQIVSIGGAATVRGTVDGSGNLTGMTVINSGCGYGAAPVVTVLTGANECTTAGSYTAVLTAGRVTSVTVTTQATGCPANPTIVLGQTPYAAHGDGATAIVGSVTGGQVVAISFSPASDNLAQLLTNTEKAPRGAAINYNGTTTPNVSAREGMVRMLRHGVNHVSAGYTGFFGVNNVNHPGIGPVHIAQNVLNNLSGAGSVMTVVNLLNSDSTSLTDMVVLIGCGDHVEYGTSTTTDFHYFCSNHSPSLW